MRRIYIIPKSTSVSDAIPVAKASDCPEIVRGIPPLLRCEVKESDLPCMYEEIVPEPVVVPTLMEEIAKIKEVIRAELGIDIDKVVTEKEVE